MRLSARTFFYWLLLGPVLALLVAFACRFVLESVSPDKLSGVADMLRVYPLGLLISLLTPWGWLMYGGLYFLHSPPRRRLGLLCTIAGSLVLGLFWPIWSTFLVNG